MRMNTFVARCAALAVLAAFCAPCLAQPPQIAIPDDARRQPELPDIYRGLIRDYVKYQVEQLGKAKDLKTMIAVRQALLEGYWKYDENNYHYEYAQVLADVTKPALGKLDGSRAVQLSLVLSRVPEVPMMPALQAMIVHPNAAVRLLGWKGYSFDMRRSVLIAGKGPQLLALLKDRMIGEKAEPAAAVYGPMLDALRMPMPGGGISPEAAKSANDRAWATIQQAWPRLCERVIGGDAEMASACRSGVTTIVYYALRGQDNDKKKALQRLVDMMYCAAVAYDNEGAEGLGADILAQLARDTEIGIGKITGQQQPFLQRSLVDPRLTADGRGAGVRLAVGQWVEALSASGVKTPKFKAPPRLKPTTTPSTAPAPLLPRLFE